MTSQFTKSNLIDKKIKPPVVEAFYFFPSGTKSLTSVSI